MLCTCCRHRPPAILRCFIRDFRMPEYLFSRSIESVLIVKNREFFFQDFFSRDTRYVYRQKTRLDIITTGFLTTGRPLYSNGAYQVYNMKRIHVWVYNHVVWYPGSRSKYIYSTGCHWENSTHCLAMTGMPFPSPLCLRIWNGLFYLHAQQQYNRCTQGPFWLVVLC